MSYLTNHASYAYNDWFDQKSENVWCTCENYCQQTCDMDITATLTLSIVSKAFPTLGEQSVFARLPCVGRWFTFQSRDRVAGYVVK